ncbi:flotillin family protein [Lyngbya sp. PCC 8106]|uniref:flotillin family protein n=1 Tax=Lyngbya sp. (strain PCC 8106) TaxID=313612 RepID=UPI0000EAC5A5|nr:SPFH domain-containing protein [Lyngbya sp. PCC 8106]EAW38441.1 Band 7 protein [Lyngbya sp. PCC 8106]
MEIIIALLATLGLGTGAGAFIIRNLYYVCQPSEVLIFAGGHQRVEEREEVGYRLVKGGSSIRIPLLEQAFRMDLTNMIIELKVANAYSKGGIPLTVESVANIKIAGEEPTIHNAIERLLGKSRNEIEQMAKETLEGNLRGVLASLTPEQVNGDKLAFAKSLLEEAEDDLERLGLILDTLQIQNISDEVGYLDSIGRQQQAELLRDARMAEAQAQATSVIRNAENKKNTSLKQLETEIEVARAEAERRVKDAMTKRDAVIAESESEIASEVARTQAELPVQKARIIQVEQRLQADIVAPAEAECKRAIARAKGDAAQIIEDGKARAEGTQRLAESWKAAGTNAREIFLYQKLEGLLQTLVSTIPEVEVDNLTVINGENGTNATKIAGFLEQLRQTTGIDVADAVRNVSQPRSPVNIVEQLDPLKEGKALPTYGSNSTGTKEEFLKSVQSEVQQFLTQIAEKTQTNIEAERAVEQKIKTDSQFKSRLQNALKMGGQDTFKTMFSHSKVYIPTAMVQSWLDQA